MSSFTRPIIWLLATFSVALAAENVQAQLRLPFQNRQRPTSAHSERPKALTEAAGPWLIMCASFSGRDGMQQAQQLAEELHSEHKLPTYLYRHQFDVEKRLAGKGFGQSIAPSGPNVIGPSKLKLASAGQFEEIAVLVGDFPSIDDGRAQQILSSVKAHQPRVNVSTINTAGDSVGDRVKAFRNDMTNEIDTIASTDGPLRLAFIMPNPLLPEAYFNRSTVDDFVIKLNKRTKYNLLKNPGLYTVKVATFSGGTKMLNDSVSEKLRVMNGNSLFKKSKKASDLETALLKATVLARYLRKHENLEAYEFHDRDASYVCVGSFDWATRQTGFGTETNPELKATLKKFTFGVQDISSRGVRAKSFPLPKKLTDVGIACSAMPEVIAVPRAESTSVASRLMNRFK